MAKITSDHINNREDSLLDEENNLQSKYDHI